MQEKDLRDQVVEAMLTLDRDALNRGSSGNVSVRFEDTMLISPSGVPPENLTAKSIAKVSLSDADGAWEGDLRPSSEWRFHRDILNAKPEAQAIVHTHAEYSTIVSILRRPIPAVHYMIAIFGGADIPLAPYARFGTQALSDGIIEALKNRLGCLMASHGMVVAGTDMKHALWLANELEMLANQFYRVTLAGGGHILSDEEIQEVIAGMSEYGPVDVDAT